MTDPVDRPPRRRSPAAAGATPAVEELAARYRTLFEENPDAMLVYGIDQHRILMANRALAALYDTTPQELAGRDVAELVIEEERRHLTSFLEQAEGDGTSSRWRARRPDGSIHRLRIVSRAVDFEGRPARLAVVSDVTRREEAEQLAERLSTILDATPDFVGIASSTLEIEYINPAGREMLKLPPGLDLATLDMETCFTAESWRTIRTQGFPGAIADGLWRGETVFTDTEGGEIPVSQVILAHRGPGGEVEFLSTVARDMRQHLELEQQLRQAQKMEAVGRLAGGIAHDFNNILTALAGYAELARADLDDPVAVHRDLQEIVQAAERAAELTGQLLAFSRQQMLEPRVVALDDVLREVETMLRRTLGEQIRLECIFASGNARIEVDPARLQQVIINLALNARDAMPGGGRLTFETSNVDLERDRDTDGYELPAGEYVVLRVSDTGTGMDEETLPHVFEPFFTTKDPGEGTGLGLSTVYGIVKQSGGYVDVDSTPGVGTTFTIHLPRSRRESEERAESAEQPVEWVGRETVLVAEDDDAVRGMIRRVLETAGHTVVAAACGAEALELRERNERRIDLLITDVVMPRMNGQRLVRELRRWDPGLPVLYISGYPYPAMGGERQPEEGSAFLQKPFSARALVEAVRGLLDRQRS